MSRAWLWATCGLFAACNAVDGLSLGKDAPQKVEVADAASEPLYDAAGRVSEDATTTAPVPDAGVGPDAGEIVDAAGSVPDAHVHVTDPGAGTSDAGHAVNPLCKLEPWHCVTDPR